MYHRYTFQTTCTTSLARVFQFWAETVRVRRRGASRDEARTARERWQGWLDHLRKINFQHEYVRFWYRANHNVGRRLVATVAVHTTAASQFRKECGNVHPFGSDGDARRRRHPSSPFFFFPTTPLRVPTQQVSTCCCRKTQFRAAAGDASDRKSARGSSPVRVEVGETHPRGRAAESRNGPRIWNAPRLVITGPITGDSLGPHSMACYQGASNHSPPN